MQGLVLSPGAGYPRYATDTHTLVYERCVIIWSLANQALITSNLSRKDERIAKSTFSQRQQVSFPTFLSHYMLNAKEEISEYPLVIYRQSISCSFSL